MASICNKCGRPIIWDQNDADKWIPRNPKKPHRIHWETCKGEPAKDTKLELRTKIEELEEERDTLKRDLAWAKHTIGQLQFDIKTLEEVRDTVFTEAQQLLDTATAWFRAKVKKTGKVRFHQRRLHNATKRYVAAKERRKKQNPV